MKILRQLLWALVYALPAVLFFSYYPVISLGANNSMNFELSLPLIWLVIFDLAAFIAMFKAHGSTLSDRRFFLLALFPLYLTLSIFWSANPLRGLLVAGVMWLIFFAVFALLYILPLTGTPPRLRQNVLRSLLISSVLVCAFCFVQSILDILGLSRETTLMCAGCTYRSFGFPHPSGFAIEPQFMGNLLLAPTLTAIYLLAFRPQFASKLRRIGFILAAFFLSTTLFFTFSRGAIYAYAVALLVLLIFTIVLKTRQKSTKASLSKNQSTEQPRWGFILAIPIASFVFSLVLQGTFAALGPTSETFTSGIAKSIHQLSLGIIDFRPSDSVSFSTSAPVSPVENSTHLVENSEETVEKDYTNVENNPTSVEKPTQNVDNSSTSSGKPVQNPTTSCAELVQNSANSVQNSQNSANNSVQNPVDNSASSAAPPDDNPVFDGYVAESTNIRLSLNHTAIQTWLSAPYRNQITVGADCSQPYSELCTTFTPSSILFGVGLGGAGTAMHARYPDVVTSPKEIVQHQGFSFLLETGLIGILLLIFELLICFYPRLFSANFLDGRAARELQSQSAAHSVTNPLQISFWSHPALPLLLALIIAYLATLNFFSGLPNALQIYLMPPLLYLIFQPQPTKTSVKSPQNRLR